MDSVEHLTSIAVTIFSIPHLIVGLSCIFAPSMILRLEIPEFEIDGLGERQIYVILRYIGVVLTSLGAYGVFVISSDPNLFGTVRIYTIFAVLRSFSHILIAFNLGQQFFSFSVCVCVSVNLCGK
eukprot:c4550_g1_i3.p1 GENE.c4550_g1_i3~~c4550_g1_i3.p1  ORF type:complete len:125 (+),score=24.20 c4550_g1_i3:104-478(+)